MLPVACRIHAHEECLFIALQSPKIGPDLLIPLLTDLWGFVLLSIQSDLCQKRYPTVPQIFRSSWQHSCHIEHIPNVLGTRSKVEDGSTVPKNIASGKARESASVYTTTESPWCSKHMSHTEFTVLCVIIRIPGFDLAFDDFDDRQLWNSLFSVAELTIW